MAKPKITLNKPIGRKNKYPEKTTINLLYRESHTAENIFSLVCFGIFLIFLYFFLRYFVFYQLHRADAAEQKYQQAEEALNEARDQNSIYDQVRQQYSHYGNGYVNDEEKAEQDRVTMLNIIDEKIHSVGGIQNIAITDNVATVTLEVASADRLPAIIETLQQSEYVSYVTAQTAGTVDKNQTAPATVTNADGSVTVQQLVNAVLTIYFRSNEEVQAAISSGTATANDAALDAGKTAVGSNAYVPEITQTEAAADPGAQAAADAAAQAQSQAAAQTQAAQTAQTAAQAAQSAAKAAAKSSTKSGSSTAASSGSSSGSAAAQTAAPAAQTAPTTAAAAGQSVNIQTPTTDTTINDLQSGKQPY